ncbi:MAG: hypothetical protein KKG09_01230 [Verrucomicrobia bacterium]|nr:hypothetical protein [Verrucomicrobiota bacterium]MCG2681193.1 hypothetical protein [Kiritimatiellia bacterium]MBU4246775.1 hypothetical protein [Verrucomicrobiota bacterium]MBU4290591.1 hypothetical protein [Verrucomicrobiota bacterium]MBU4429732.1 hypothetical protein [Verrucomicrobiota bacterium]
MKTIIIIVAGISIMSTFALFSIAQDIAQDAKTNQVTEAAKKSAEEAQVKAKRDIELQSKAAAEARKKAALAAKAKKKEADSAQRDAMVKAEKAAAAKAAVARVTKAIAERKSDEAVNVQKAADEPALANAKVKAEADQAARKAKVRSRIAEGTVAISGSQPETEAQLVAGKATTIASKELEEGKWRVTVGMLYRRIGVQRFKAGSYSSGYKIGSKSGDDHWDGPADQDGNRTYDNGYVRSDDFTDLDGGTWNWGYTSGRQVEGNTIDFSGVNRVWREYSRQVTVVEGETSDNADSRGGLLVEAERYLAQTRYLDCGLRLGVSREQTFQASGEMSTFEDKQQWDTLENRVVDTYNISGTGITPDSTVYRGNRSDQGPVIDTAPMIRREAGSELVSSETYRAYNIIADSLDMDLSTFSLGLSVKGKYGRVYLTGSTGPTLNLVNTDATYAETLYESSNGGESRPLMYWEDSTSGTECLFGYYVQGEVGVKIYRGLQAGVFGRYDWLENISGNVGQSRYEVNPAGGSMGGTVGLQF